MKITFGAFMLAILAMFMLPDLMPAVHASEAAATEATSAAAPASAAASDAAAEPVANAITFPPAPKLTEADYPTISGVNPRVTVWLVAQLHLWFGAFVVAVPMFVFIIESIGMMTRDERYDNMAYEFIKVSITAYSLTAILGGLLSFGLNRRER